MGAFCALTVAAIALLRSGDAVYGVFVTLEITLLLWRFADWRLRERRLRVVSAHVPIIDYSALISVLW
jgi:hypothetical protein